MSADNVIAHVVNDPTRRQEALAGHRRGSADGLLPSTSRKLPADSAPLSAPLAVMVGSSGSELTTALKFPLVPSAHPLR